MFDNDTLSNDISFSNNKNDVSVKNEFQSNLSPELKERLEKELLEIESDIQMLKETLNSKNDRANNIRRELGITQFDQFKHTMNDGLAKTSAVLNTAKDKTFEFANNVKNSETYKNTEAKLENFFSQVKHQYIIVSQVSTGYEKWWNV